MIGERIQQSGVNSNGLDIDREIQNRPSHVRAIGNRGFQSCTSLTSITIPDLITSFPIAASNPSPSYGRKDDPTKTSITIPKGANCIDLGTFERYKNLTSITLPDSLTFISFLTFSYCDRLKYIAIDDTNLQKYERVKAMVPYNRRHLVKPLSLINKIHTANQRILENTLQKIQGGSPLRFTPMSDVCKEMCPASLMPVASCIAKFLENKVALMTQRKLGEIDFSKPEEKIIESQKEKARNLIEAANMKFSTSAKPAI